MSEPSGSPALVCGVWDEATGFVGIGWDLGIGPNLAGALASDGSVTAATAELSDEEDGTLRVTLESGSKRLEAELTPRSTAEGDPNEGDAPAPVSCAAKVSLDGDTRAVECQGHVTRWRGSPIEGAGLFRHIAIPAPDGGLIVATAVREPGQGDHSAERAAAWLLETDGGATRFDEALLSTQYDADGRQTRVGLELWPSDAEAPAMRAAATSLGVAQVDGVSAAPLRSSAEGTPGLGAYVIWRQ